MANTEKSRAPAESVSLSKESQNFGEGNKETFDNTNTTTSRDEDVGESALHTPAQLKPPDGGTKAWLVILGTWCVSFCTFGWLNSIGAFQQYYQEVLFHGYSASTVSWIASLQIFLVMGGGPFAGLIYDRYGPRWLLLIGSFLYVFGIMMASLGSKYYQILLAQGLCSAIGSSMLFQPSITAATGWFLHKRAIAMGIAFTGASTGGVVFPIMVPHLIARTGFGWTMRICAFLILTLLIVANLTIRAYLPPRPYKVTLAQLAKPLKETQFFLVLTGVFCICFGYFPVLNYLPVQAASAGMAPHLQHYLLAILNGASLFGRLGTGFAGDAVGRYNTFIIVCYATGIFILALWLPDQSTAALIAFGALFGFFSGGFFSVLTPLIAQISPMPELGFRIGIGLFTASIAGLVTSPICGAIQKSTEGWNGVKIFSGVLFVFGTTTVVIARVKETGMKLFVKI